MGPTFPSLPPQKRSQQQHHAIVQTRPVTTIKAKPEAIPMTISALETPRSSSGCGDGIWKIEPKLSALLLEESWNLRSDGFCTVYGIYVTQYINNAKRAQGYIIYPS